MIEQTAIVLRTHQHLAVVEVGRQSSCTSCSAKGCGTGSLAKVFGNKTITLELENTIQAKPGDEVVIGIQEQVLIKGSLLAYILPLVLMMVGGLAGSAMVDSTDEIPVLIGATTGLGFGLLWLRHLGRKLQGNADYNAVILRRTVKDQELFHPVNFIQPKS